MKKVAITGAKGTIGSVLVKGLSGLEIIPIDLPETDVLDQCALEEKVRGCEVLIHLAWKYTEPNSSQFRDSARMFSNAYKAAVDEGVKRVIMASSVHAGNGTAYGELKSEMEDMSHEYASKYPLEVIVIRFGGVNKEDKVLLCEKDYEKIWLRHEDCISVVQKCIDKETVSDNFELITAVSNSC